MFRFYGTMCGETGTTQRVYRSSVPDNSLWKEAFNGHLTDQGFYKFVVAKQSKNSDTKNVLGNQWEVILDIGMKNWTIEP